MIINLNTLTPENMQLPVGGKKVDRAAVNSPTVNRLHAHLLILILTIRDINFNIYVVFQMRIDQIQVSYIFRR